MKKPIILTVVLVSLLAASSLRVVWAGCDVTELWNNPMGSTDVAVSNDGKYVAAVNDTALCFFSSGSQVPLWWYLNNTNSERFLSVAISANGEYVIVGNNTNHGSIYYFGNSRTRIGLQASNSYNWTSEHFEDAGLGTDVERGTIDISDNGEYVAVGGTGLEVYYFSDCTSKSGANQPWDWAAAAPFHVTTLDMSQDGNYIAVGGALARLHVLDSVDGVAFFTKATTAQHQLKWSNNTRDSIEEVEVSDDGYAVAAVSMGPFRTLYYWANSAGLSGTPDATWTRMHEFSSVDMSSDGDKIVAGCRELDVASLHFWDDARTRYGNNETETWIDLQTLNVMDVAISNDGSIIAATSGLGIPQVYFFTSSDSLIKSFNLTAPDFVLSMSGSGGIVAVGGGIIALDSVTLFGVTLTRSMPVGGFDVSPNYFTVLLRLAGPWIVVTVACLVLSAVVLKKTKKYRGNT